MTDQPAGEFVPLTRSELVQAMGFPEEYQPGPGMDMTPAGTVAVTPAAFSRLFGYTSEDKPVYGWDHPEYADWRSAVGNGDTLRGFHDWLASGPPGER